MRFLHTVSMPIEINGGEVDVSLVLSILPADPGKLSGPPEDCYPPEPAEVEIVGASANFGPLGIISIDPGAVWDIIGDEDAQMEWSEQIAEEAARVRGRAR